MAEAGDLKSSQCGFESHLGHRRIGDSVRPEVQVLMEPAARVEGRLTRGAAACVKVVQDRHGFTADAAENRMSTLLPQWPHGRLMVGSFLMAEVARVELAAALEPDGNDVELGLIVHTSSLVVDCLAEDVDHDPEL